MEQFIEDLKQFQSAPFLFLGSGFSRRYLDSPSWDGLLKMSAKWTGKNYAEYLSRIIKYSPDHPMHLPHLASLIAKDFGSVWWNSEEYDGKREESSELITDYLSPLKIVISEYLSKFVLVTESKIQEEIEAIELLKDKNSIDGIITTNWDCLAESIFGYKKYIGQQELLFSNVLNVGEIYKIHGCITSPNSLVLDEKDYEQFNQRNPYLAAKLTTIFIEHPIVFIGYSLRDDNIREILNSIVYGIGETNAKIFGKSIFFIEYDFDDSGSIYSDTVVDLPAGKLEIKYIKTNDYVSIYEALGSNERKFPARLVRQMKEHLYELLLTDDPKEQIYVATDLITEEEMEKVQFVYGAGVIERLSSTGYRTFSNVELLKNIVGIGTNDFDYKEIVNSTLMGADKHWVPVHKFISKSELDETLISDRILRRRLLTHSSLFPYTQNPLSIRINGQYNSLQELINSELEIHKKIEYAVFLVPQKVNSSELLRKLITDNITEKDEISSHLRRLIKYYDWLKYELKKD